jgi:ABC-type dipeptide/oligopeptide/nickel transport system ATPase subunit
MNVMMWRVAARSLTEATQHADCLSKDTYGMISVWPHMALVPRVAIFPRHRVQPPGHRPSGEIHAEVDLPERVLERFPHQLSGGWQQRIGIVMALIAEPALLILG